MYNSFDTDLTASIESLLDLVILNFFHVSPWICPDYLFTVKVKLIEFEGVCAFD